VSETLAQWHFVRRLIDNELAGRTKAHQAKIADLLKEPIGTEPLVLVAIGDSWLDYPLNGNSLSLEHTDLAAQLAKIGSPLPLVYDLSHYGETSTAELWLPKRIRLRKALENPANWLQSGKPDAILFSGGGNDVAGDQFCMFLNGRDSGGPALNNSRFRLALDNVQSSYELLFRFRDRFAPGVPIFGHAYDFPIPNGTHPALVGPWLKPSFEFEGWTDLEENTRVMRYCLSELGNLLRRLSEDKRNNFHFAETQGLLRPEHWANELHPTAEGFRICALRFADKLREYFPGRI
jgi:hypothetical protein